MVERTLLGSYRIAPDETISRVEIHRLMLPPGAKTGMRHHPYPVVNYMLAGSVVVQIEGDVQRLFGAGDVVFEPADTTVLRFDNASDTLPATFVASYLQGADENELINRMLEFVV